MCNDVRLPSILEILIRYTCGVIMILKQNGPVFYRIFSFLSLKVASCVIMNIIANWKICWEKCKIVIYDLNVCTLRQYAFVLTAINTVSDIKSIFDKMEGYIWVT